MPSRQSNDRLRRFEVEERQQKVAEVEAMIADFKRVAEELDKQVLYEEQRAGISDPGHFAYPMFAKAARQRRDNLWASIRDLNAKLAEARQQLEEAREALQTAESMAQRDTQRTRRPSTSRLAGHFALPRD
jgi:flagellar export protein FliJ